MSLRCKLGIHEWDGCVCRRCSGKRDKHHDWSKDCEVCARCGRSRKEIHRFDYERCTVCGKERDKSMQGSFTDPRDGHEYRTIRIGNQVWMAENLAWLPGVSSQDTGSDTLGHCYVYGYDGSDIGTAKNHPNYAHYGVLYNWLAAVNACPPGWHLPSDEEWKILEKFEGMNRLDAERLNFGDRSSGSVGTKLKSGAEWGDGDNGKNTHGFTALPGGYRGFDGGFFDLGDYASFWSSTEGRDKIYALARYLDYNCGGVFRTNYSYKRGGLSVRCLKDD
jgi:uncharacterized protein (TIGR02145 family)